VSDAEIEQALDRAAMRTAITLPSGLLGRIGNSLGPRIEAVRPLPATGILVAGLAILIALVAIVGAWRTGFAGFAALPAGSRWVIFGALGTLGCVAAARAVAEWIPGSPARLGSAGLLTLVCFTLLVLFGLLFRDHTTTNFMAAGIACLTTGLIWAVPAALLALGWLRRGWAVNPVAAGVAAGVLAGLAGLTLLELRCTNFEAFHILLWHVLVVPLSAAAGAALGWSAHRLHPRLPPRLR